MTLNKKYFEKIAEILKQTKPFYQNNELEKDSQEGYFIWGCIVRKLAQYFATENINFDRQKFLTACGVEK